MKNTIISVVMVLVLGLISTKVTAQIDEKTNADSLEMALPHVTNKSKRLDILVKLFKYYQHRDLGKTLMYCTEAHELASAISNKKAMEDVLVAQATVYLRMDENDSALVYYAKWIDYAKREKNKVLEARAHSGLGVLYGKKAMYKEALMNFEKGKKIFKEMDDTLQYMHIQGNIAVTYKMMGELDKAMEIFTNKELNHLAELKHDSQFLAINQQNIAHVLVNKKKYEEAKIHFNKALEIIATDTTHYLYGEILVDLGELYLLTGELELAASNTQEGIRLARQFGDPESLMHALKSFADIKRAQNDFKGALAHMEMYWTIKDSISSNVVNEKMANAKSLYTIKEQKQQLEAFTQNEALQSYRLKYILGTFSFAIVTILLILLYFIGKTKSNRLKQQVLVDQVAHQKGDLINLSLYIGQKNELLEFLKQEIKTIKRTQNEALRNEQLSELLILVSQKTGVDRDIEILQSQMKTFSSEFTTQLIQKHPDLTNNEKTLAGMLRLGFSTKEIAVMLNSVENTVNVNRYRLRKKLGLSRETNLVAYLNQI